ncbi:MAG: hypothetical protein QXD48_01365 [Candidatus Aenigmatarchaeota archaeon]
MKKRFCPICKSSRMRLFIGYQTGNYNCQNCGYVEPDGIKEKKILFIILDGAADYPRSAFAVARMSNLNEIAKKSLCGVWSGPYAPNYNLKNMSSVATLELLGYSYKDEPGRGYLEALGIGIKPNKNSIYLRANFATVDKNINIVDRRAGRNYFGLDELTKELNKKIRNINDIRIKLYRSVGHRGVLVLTGNGLSKYVSDNDIGGRKPEKICAKIKKAEKTANILNEYIKKSYEILSKHPINKKRKIPANFLLLRAAGSLKYVNSFRKKYGFNACSISGVGIIKGISKYIGINIIKPKINEDYERNLRLRLNIALKCLKKYDFVLLHINGADICSHNKDFRKKVKFLESVDRNIFSELKKMENINIVVICDHATSSKTGEHIFGSVPFLLHTTKNKKNNIKKFDENNCKNGFKTKNPMKKILDEIV